MSIENGQKFLRYLKTDEALCAEVNRAGDDYAVLEIAAKEGFQFSYEEFFAARGLESASGKTENTFFEEVEIDMALSGW